MIQTVDPIKFREDDADDMRAFDLITEMYRSIEHPFFSWSSDGYKHLRIPPTIAKVFPIPARNEQEHSQA